MNLKEEQEVYFNTLRTMEMDAEQVSDALYARYMGGDDSVSWDDVDEAFERVCRLADERIQLSHELAIVYL